MTEESRTSIPVEMTEEQKNEIELWFNKLEMSQREAAEMLIRLGRAAAIGYEDKVPSGSSIKNRVAEIGVRFASGEFAVDFEDGEEVEGDPYERWRARLGMSKSAFDRHLQSIGIIVYELSERPLEPEEFIYTIAQIGSRLLASPKQNMVETMKRFEEAKRAAKKERATPRNTVMRFNKQGRIV